MADKTLTLGQWDDVAMMAAMAVLGDEATMALPAPLEPAQVDATLTLLERIGEWQQYFLVDGDRARGERLTIDLPEHLPFRVEAVGP